MLDYLGFRKSISNELIAVKDRVRNLIGEKHWGEEGRYKETVLMQVLRNYLPETIKVGTGFVVSNGELSTQIDIIVYQNSIRPFFSTGDFVIIEKSGVKGIIEVKTRLNRKGMAYAIKKAQKNGLLINEPIFNGIFAYESDFDTNTDSLPPSAITALKNNKSGVNHISFGSDFFMRYWSKSELSANSLEHISFYRLNHLSFGYFISNLVEAVSDIIFNDEQQRYYYPITEGKGSREIKRLKIIPLCEQEEKMRL